MDGWKIMCFGVLLWLMARRARRMFFTTPVERNDATKSAFTGPGKWPS
jgi:hypothetical protein